VRHVGTLLAALVIAPVAWVLLAFGQARSARAFAVAADGGGLHAADFRAPLLVLAAAGVLFGLIGTLRFSPVGALVAGALYVNSFAMLAVAPDDWLRLFDRTLSIAGRQADLATPIRSGTTLVLGALLLVAVVSVSRWRRRPAPGPEPSYDEERVPIEPEFASRYPTGSRL
jgi:hypothetical protein